MLEKLKTLLPKQQNGSNNPSPLFLSLPVTQLPAGFLITQPVALNQLGLLEAVKVVNCVKQPLNEHFRPQGPAAEKENVSNTKPQSAITGISIPDTATQQDNVLKFTDYLNAVRVVPVTESVNKLDAKNENSQSINQPNAKSNDPDPVNSSENVYNTRERRFDPEEDNQ